MPRQACDTGRGTDRLIGVLFAGSIRYAEETLKNKISKIVVERAGGRGEI
ncbi:MAG: hypothetical protein QG552_1528 [Thermodesulfobacteriota bacterium]|nr:hypothetical protein [Thermodesulfobacteriota bacterium]